MARLMSVSHTEDAVHARTKTVTRRLGWRDLQPGARLTLCRKLMGLRKGDKVERICDVEVVSVRRERLSTMPAEDVAREGFPEWQRTNFIGFFCRAMKCTPDTEVTRIEWRYL